MALGNLPFCFTIRAWATAQIRNTRKQDEKTKFNSVRTFS